MTDAATPGFSYERAFSRNLGWVTEWEQQALRHKRVAIAGMGGVGGAHLLTLARLGVGAFSIADLDVFEIENFNRQAGATMDTIDRPKVAVMAERARQINPELDIACFDRGIDAANLDAFLAGVDLFVDSLDFFVLDIRRAINARCRRLGIPVINAAPLGLGTAYIIFTPEGMSFEDWFRLDGLTEEQQYVSYLVGMAPRALHRPYLVDLSRVDLRGKRGPSTVAACELCAGVAAAEALKLLLRRGRVRAAPWYHQFDPYRGRFVSRRLRGGNAHPAQRLKIALARRFAAHASRQAAVAPAVASGPTTELEKILDLARWAPSGDNIQPWRFEIVDDEHLVVHLRPSGDVYDYNEGEPTLLACGFLLETIRIAATGYCRRCSWEYRGFADGVHQIAVSLPYAAEMTPDPLISHIPTRSVDRRRYRLKRLTAEQKAELAASLGSGLTIEWHEALRARWRQARLNARGTDIRLRIPEAHEVHRRIIDWDNRFSPTGIPAAAVGLDPVALRLTRWAMRSWRRVHWLNQLSGTWLAQIEMDLVPGLFSGAHFSVARSSAIPGSGTPPAASIATGASLQRLWIAAARLGLVMQPTLAALCFAAYGAAGTRFTDAERMRAKAAALSRLVRDAGSGQSIFRGRIGTPAANRVTARSVRRDAAALGTRSN